MSIRKAPPLLSPRATKHGPVGSVVGDDCSILRDQVLETEFDVVLLGWTRAGCRSTSSPENANQTRGRVMLA
jgi:hypothetical protein